MMRNFFALALLSLLLLPAVAGADEVPAAMPTALGTTGMLVLLACGFITWLVKRVAPGVHFFQTPAGTAVLTGASALTGAIAIAIQAHGFSWAVVQSAMLTGAFSLLAGTNPTMAAQARDNERGALPIDSSARALLPLLLMSSLVLSACAPAYAGIYAGLASAERTVGVAAQQFPALDKEKRDAIVAGATSAADGKAKLADWDITSDRLTKAIVGTDASVRLARDAVAEIAAGKRNKQELSGWIATAIELGIDIKNVLAASGVQLKGL